MDAFRAAYRAREVERNRERLRQQAWPQPKRPAVSLILAEGVLRERRYEAIKAQGNLLAHMMGYTRAPESRGLPKWCDEVQQWQRKLLEGIVVYRVPGTWGQPTIRSSFVTTEPYVYDEGSPSVPIWRRGLVPHGLYLLRLPDDWRTLDPDCGLSQKFLIAPREMIQRISEFDRDHGYLKPRKAKPTPDAPPDMSNVLDLMSKRSARA
jgi:hypothetical protein